MTQVFPAWMMIRDIREGDVWESLPNDAGEETVYVTNLNGNIVWCDQDGKPTYQTDSPHRIFRASRYHLTYTWRNRPALVDFATAWAAYEAGKRIYPEWSAYGYYKPKVGSETSAFTPTEIRGKWVIVEDEGGAAN